jgi:hypothetical protein
VYVLIANKYQDSYRECTQLKHVAVSSEPCFQGDELIESYSSVRLAKLIAEAFSKREIQLETITFHWRETLLGPDEIMPEALTFRIWHKTQGSRSAVYAERVFSRHMTESEAVGSNALGLDMKRGLFDFMRKDYPLLPPAGQDLSRHWSSPHGVVLPVKLGKGLKDNGWTKNLLRDC